MLKRIKRRRYGAQSNNSCREAFQSNPRDIGANGNHPTTEKDGQRTVRSSIEGKIQQIPERQTRSYSGIERG
jgi:hypothetical protein